MKKTVALVTLACFLVFSCSCVFYKWEMVKLESVKPENKKSAKISAVQLQSGEKIDFSKRQPAQIVGERVVGNKIGYENIEIARNEIDQLSVTERGKVLGIITKDGRSYHADQIIKEERDYFVVKIEKFANSFPFKDIKLIWIRQVDIALTLLVDIGAAVAIGFGIVAKSMEEGFSFNPHIIPK
jgi:hypothetical protein